MIQLNNLLLSFGQQTIFDDVSDVIMPHQKIGLVGRNGSGKTTLLKAIAGDQHLDDGNVHMPASFNCAFMPQDVVLTSNKSIINESLGAFPELGKLLEELSELEQAIENKQADNQAMERYAALHHHLYEHDYESKRAQATQMLIDLGFKQEQLDHSVAQLSVGWKMRLVLAKLLLQKADFYLFDEPTNHLDLFAKEWFLGFLKSAPFGFILVSHDEYFLNTSCDYIFEISQGNLTAYRGCYKDYIKQKEADSIILEKKYAEQQKFIKKQQAVIDRFRAKASKASMVQSMVKQLGKIEKIELEHDQKTVKFSLPSVERSGKIVLELHDLSFSFGPQKIFEHATCKIKSGHKVSIVAPNGMGKSTLLNVVMGKYSQGTGRYLLGHNVVSAFFEQDQNQSLNPGNTILEEVEAACTTAEARARARNLLGAFLFTGDDVHKKIDVLSGGEKNRVAMVKILLQNANFLVLDEPTNHLDIISKRILCDVLKHFKGTILFVSHDRTFLNDLATDIIELTPTTLYYYSGNYDSYLYHKKHLSDSSQKREQESRAPSGPSTKKASSKSSYTLRKEIGSIEGKIKKLEEKISSLSEQFASLSYGTPEYDAANAKLNECQVALKKAYARWEELMSKLENGS